MSAPPPSGLRHDPTAPKRSSPMAEVSFVTKDSWPSGLCRRRKLAEVVELEDLLMRVARFAYNGAAGSAVKYASLAMRRPTQSGSQSDSRKGLCPAGLGPRYYAGFEKPGWAGKQPCCRRQRHSHRRQSNTETRFHVVKKGDTVTSILRDQGATTEEAQIHSPHARRTWRDGGLKEGQRACVSDGAAAMAPASGYSPTG